MFFSLLLLNALASLNLGFGVFYALQTDVNPLFPALHFGVALFCTLMTIALIGSALR